MLFVPIKFKTRVQLSPSELDSKYQERIYEKLRNTYEGLCTKFGYIKPDSIEIVKRSYGSFIKEHFNGFIKFEVVCRAEVCNPTQGSIVKAVIKNKNQLGILAESLMDIEDKHIPILDIIIPIKSAGIISQIDLDSLAIGDVIHVEVMGKKYQINDKKISIIGRVISSKKEEEEEFVEELVIDEDQEEEFDLQDGEPLLEDDEEDEDDEDKKKRVIAIDEEESDDDLLDGEDSEKNEFEEDVYEEDVDDVEGGGAAAYDDDY